MIVPHGSVWLHVPFDDDSYLSIDVRQSTTAYLVLEMALATAEARALATFCNVIYCKFNAR